MEKDYNYRNDSEVNALRELRDSLTEQANKLYKQSNDVQKEIDDLIIKKNNFDTSLIGKYVYTNYNTCSEYIHVLGIDRIFSGIKVFGKGFTISEGSIDILNDMYIAKRWEYINEIKEISKEEFNSILETKIKSFEF